MALLLAKLPDRYPILTLDIDSLDVWLTVNTREIVGRLRLTPAGKPRYQERISLRKFEDLPKTASVTLWRPVEPHAWPYELPEPAIITREIERRVPEPSEPEETVSEGLGWPVPGVRLGRPHEPPESVSEVEGRLLRALRTQFVMEREGRKQDMAWLPALMVKATYLEKQLMEALRHNPRVVIPGWRAEDYEAFHIDLSALEARPVPWVPTARDISDYESRAPLLWLKIAPKRDAWLYAARAKLPPFSWRQIAEEERDYPHVVKQRYQNGLKKIFRRVGK